MDFSALMTKEINKKKKENINKSGISNKIIRKSEINKKRNLEYSEKQLLLEKEKNELRRINDQEHRKQQEKDEKRREIFAERLKSRQSNQLDAETKNELNRDELTLQIKQLAFKQSIDHLTNEQLQQLLKELKESNQLEKELKEEEKVDFAIEPNEIASKIDKIYVQMRAFIKYLLLEWQQTLENRKLNQAPISEEEEDKIERTSESIFLEVSAHLEPLMTMLRSKSLSDDIYPTLATLLMYLQQKNFIQANTAYISLSIGNAAWPIGVLAVGIHQRSALSRITGISGDNPNANVANIVKDEKTRRWILSVKRLITFAECYLG